MTVQYFAHFSNSCKRIRKRTTELGCQPTGSEMGRRDNALKVENDGRRNANQTLPSSHIISKDGWIVCKSTDLTIRDKSGPNMMGEYQNYG